MDQDSPEELDRQPSAEVLEGASVSGGSPLPAQQETPEANQRASNEGDAQIDGGSAQAEPTPMVAETPQDEDHSDNPEAPADPTPGAPVIESASKVLEKVERQAGGSDKADQAEGLRQQSTKVGSSMQILLGNLVQGNVIHFACNSTTSVHNH